MSTFKDLNAAALLGTRRAPPENWQDPLLARLSTALKALKPEQKLLAMAGSLRLYEASGRVAEQYQTPAPLAKDAQAACSPETARLLGLVLDGRHPGLLSEVLALLAQHQQRLPETLLPGLLERAAKQQALRPLVTAVLGETGRWLAAQNPGWYYATDEVQSWAQLLASWRTDRESERQRLIKQLRSQSPEQARQFIETIWKSTNPNSRVWMVRALHLGLSPDDEPFLEQALDDRNYTVRQKAAELLSSLPDSRLSGRMALAALELIHWTPDGPSPISLSLADTLTLQLARDGVKTPGWRDLNKVKQAQLADIISLTPLQTWTNAWQVSPQAIVSAALQSDAPRAFIKGLTLAAERQGNEDWAEVLLRLDDLSVTTVKLVQGLSRAGFERLLEHCLETAGKEDRFLRALNRWPHPWDADLLGRWSAYVESRLARPPDVLLRTSLKQAARNCPAELAGQLSEQLAALAALGPEWQHASAEARELLYFRQRLFQSFQTF